MFEPEVLKIVNKSAVQIRETQLENGQDGAFPNELQQLLDQKLLFKVKVSPFNIRTGSYVYTVLKTCHDQALITQMNHCNPMVQVNEGFDSVKLDESSQGCFDSRDALSFTADSAVVLDVENSATSHLAKRVKPSRVNDDLLQASTTKKKLLPVKIEKP